MITFTETVPHKTVSVLYERDGEPYRKGYTNSPQGRAELQAEQPPEIVAEVMAIWGDVPTMEDPQPEPETPTIQPTPTIEQRTSALESAILAMLGGVANV